MEKELTSLVPFLASCGCIHRFVWERNLKHNLRIIGICYYSLKEIYAGSFMIRFVLLLLLVDVVEDSVK